MRRCDRETVNDHRYLISSVHTSSVAQENLISLGHSGKYHFRVPSKRCSGTMWRAEVALRKTQLGQTEDQGDEGAGWSHDDVEPVAGAVSDERTGLDRALTRLVPHHTTYHLWTWIFSILVPRISRARPCHTRNVNN